ncbi:hypothetical protein Hanom_Chr11g01044271 [Helianthus anomalus]
MLNVEAGAYVEDDDNHIGCFGHCKYYLLSQTSTQEIAMFVGADGEFRVPMV